MNLRRRAIVPLSLGLGMLGVVVAAGLSPNTGVVRAAANCTYGQCPASQTFPLWAVATSLAAVVVALLLALLLLRRRRRPGQPPSEWQGPGGTQGSPPSAGQGAGPELAPLAAGGGAAAMDVTPAWHEGTATESSYVPPAEEGAPPTAGVGPSYVEPPSVAPPAPVAPTPVASTGAPAAAGGEAGEEAEPDIDSLMAELEKISGEILKRNPKKKNGSSAPADTSGDESS